VSDATTPTFNPNITSGCVPLTVEFTNTSPNIASCTWEFGNGTQVTGPGVVSATFDQAACYDVTLTTTALNGCVSTYTAIDLICTDALPEASFIQSTASISELNSTVNFSNTSAGATNYIWNFGDNTSSVFSEDPTHTFSTDQLGNYTTILIAISTAGCIDTAYSNVTVYEELIYYIPNTFTPDGNYSNPTFRPIFTSGYDPFDFTLTIYNRWGGVVFESHDVKIGWDGTFGSNGEIDSVQDGTYSWKIEFKTTVSDERKKIFGHVNVLR
jgi:gliding motility-associated-like protein